MKLIRSSAPCALAVAAFVFSNPCFASGGAVEKLIPWQFQSLSPLRSRNPLVLPGGLRDALDSAHDFYAAGGEIIGLQNGLAIAGDFMSAGAFLGLTALGL